MDIRKEFGNAVRNLRLAKKWSQEDLAEASGLDRTYLSGIECGGRNPTLAVVAKIAKALDVSPSVLFGTEADR